MGLPGPHPWPPADLHNRRLPVRQLGELYRTYDLERDPLFFGRSGTKRFDDPEENMAYCTQLRILTVLSSRHSANCVHTQSPVPKLKRKGLARLMARHRLVFVDLAAPGALARLSADSRLFAGDYDTAQLWSRAFYECPFQGWTA